MVIGPFRNDLGRSITRKKVLRGGLAKGRTDGVNEGVGVSTLKERGC